MTRSFHERPHVQCGTVTAIEGATVKVMVGKLSACDHCRSRLACGVSRKGVYHTVDAYPRSPMKQGTPVRLELSSRSAALAICIAFVLPVVLMVTVFAFISNTTPNELIAGLGALTAVPAYYIVLYTGRNRLKQYLRIHAYSTAGTDANDAPILTVHRDLES